MTPEQYIQHLQRQQQAIDHALRRTLPVMVGRMATDFFKGNFRQGGFRNGGLQQWPKTLRQQAGGKSASAQYGPLMSARQRLYGSIRYVPGDYRVVVGTTVPYAAIHNEGGSVTTHPRITPKMRKFAWRQYFEAGGPKSKSPEAGKWKALALTKKDRLTVTARIPRRQFLGESRELNAMVRECVVAELTRIIKS